MPEPYQPVLRLNQPMVTRLRRCAADPSPNWAGAVTVYPPEALELVALIDAVTKLVDCAHQLDRSERDMVLRAEGCGWCGADHLAELPGLRR